MSECDIVSDKYKSQDNGIGINEWDNASFYTVLSESFNKTRLNKFVIQMDCDEDDISQTYRDVYDKIYGDNGIIKKMMDNNADEAITENRFIEFIDIINRKSREGENVPHIALSRVVIVDAENNTYSYPIPYLFISGTLQNGLDRIETSFRKDFKKMAELPKNTSNKTVSEIAKILTGNNSIRGADQKIQEKVRTIKKMTNISEIERFAAYVYVAENFIVGNDNKNLNNLMIDVESCGVKVGKKTDDMNFYHSERAIGLSFAKFDTTLNLLNKIIKYHNNTNSEHQAHSAFIQIKTSLPICSSCQNFWSGNAKIDGNNFSRNSGENFILMNHFENIMKYFLMIANRAPIIGF